MLIKVSNGSYDALTMYNPKIEYTAYFDNIDKAKGFVEGRLVGENWSANHPGMVFDMYVYDKQYFSVVGGQIKAFKFYKIEMV
jgi:hypothetical protein